VFSCTNNKEETACYKLYLKQRSCEGNKEIAANIPFPSLQINVCIAHENHSLETWHAEFPTVSALKMKVWEIKDLGLSGLSNKISQKDKNEPQKYKIYGDCCVVM
jgi:hypothetical protein